jgi:hypothetical protein
MERVHQGRSASNDLEQALDEFWRALRRVVRLRSGSHCDFRKRERVLLEVLNEAGREELERDLQRRADRQPAVFRLNGQRFTPHCRGKVTYHSFCGPLQVERWVYRRRGVHNGSSLVPLEVTAAILERATPAFAEGVARAQAKAPMRSYHEDLLAAHRQPPSRTTLERIAGRLGAAVHQSIDEIEPLVRQTEELPDRAQAISFGIDRTTVPMEERRSADTPPNSRRPRRTKPYVRKPPPPIDVNYRMAYVGTVSLTDHHGDALVTKRYAIAAHEDPRQMVDRMIADVRQALIDRPILHLGLVQDGAPELWGLMWDALDKEGLKNNVHQAIDRYHLNQRIAAALAIIEPDEHKQKSRLARWNDRLDRSDKAIDGIAWSIRCALKKHCGQDRRTLSKHYDYIDGFRSRMRYATLRKLGLPVGSGATEGACKSLITARAKRSGQRWHRDGVASVLALRSIHQSGRFDAFWPRFSQRQSHAALVGL